VKYLIIGLGHMGKRRIRNLFELNIPKSEIFGFDLSEDKKNEVKEKYGITIVDNPDSIINEIDAIIICTSPLNHRQPQKYAIDNGKDFFCEVGLNDVGLEELLNIAKVKNIKAVPSKTPILYKNWKIVKKLISEEYVGKPISFNYHSGCFLPYAYASRKTDIQNLYTTKRESGSTREMLAFQMRWIQWIFGNANSVFSIKGKLSNDFKADIDDNFTLTCIFKENVFANIMVDAIAKPCCEMLEVTCTKGTIFHNLSYKRSVEVIRDGEKEWTSFPIDKIDSFERKNTTLGEVPYIEEMKDFINFVKDGIDYGFSYNDELKAIAVLNAAELSAKKGKMIKLDS
jgi:predicted dehydrogenase